MAKDHFAFHAVIIFMALNDLLIINQRDYSSALAISVPKAIRTIHKNSKTPYNQDVLSVLLQQL